MVLAARTQLACAGEQRLAGRRRVVQHALREQEVEGAIGERQAQGIGLDQGHMGQMGEPSLGDVDRRRDVGADVERTGVPGHGVEPQLGGEGAAAADIEYALALVARRPVGERGEPVLRQIPGDGHLLHADAAVRVGLVPFEAEGLGGLLLLGGGAADEARDAVAQRIGPAAGGIGEPLLLAGRGVRQGERGTRCGVDERQAAEMRIHGVLGSICSRKWCRLSNDQIRSRRLVVPERCSRIRSDTALKSMIW